MKSTARTGYKNSDSEELIRIYFDQIKSYPLLEPSEELALSRLIQEGNKEALHRLIQGNLRLVVKIARQYRASDVPFIDLIQEGNVGLIQAAEKYDHAKNVRFCTYAAWWIRQFIARYLTNKRRIVRLPHRKEEILRRIQHTYHILSQTMMHQPRNEDIAKELGIPVKDVDFIIGMTTGHLALEASRKSHDDNAGAIDSHEDYTYNPERALFKKYYRERTRGFLNRLKNKERQVLAYRYQLEGSGPQTLKEIAEKMDLSPETVRQLELRALAKIRIHAEELKQFDSMEAM